MAVQLQLNLTDYRSQLEEAMRSPSTHHISLTNDILAIKKVASRDLSFRIAVIHLEEIELRTSLPEFMAAIAKSITEMSDELAAKDSLIEKLNKGIRFSKELILLIILKNNVLILFLSNYNFRNNNVDGQMHKICHYSRRLDTKLIHTV